MPDDVISYILGEEMGPFNSKGEVALSEDMVWWWQVPLFLAFCATNPIWACVLDGYCDGADHAHQCLQQCYPVVPPLCLLLGCTSAWVAS